MIDEKTEQIKLYLNKIIYIKDNYGDTVYDDNVLGYSIELPKKHFDIQTGKELAIIIKYTDNIYNFSILKRKYDNDILEKNLSPKNFDQLLNFLTFLKHQNKQRIIDGLEKYMVENS